MKNLQNLMILLFAELSVEAGLKVMTYNIRYANEKDKENNWTHRKEHLAGQLKVQKPDIFGVQEALLFQLEFLMDAVHGYEYFGKGRDDGAQKGEFSAIFFKPEKFELLEQGTFWLSSTPAVPGKGWDAAYPRVCTYGRFKEKATGKQFWVFNTHFDHVGKEARNKSAQLIHKKIEALNKDGDPAILLGDLNLEPETEEVKFLASHYNDSKGTAENIFGPAGTFNNFEFNKAVTRRIDYIFTGGNVKVKKYEVLSDSKDFRYPSDHLPVLVHLDLP